MTISQKTKQVGAGVILALMLTGPAQATSIRDYEAMQPDAQAHLVVSFLEKMTYEIGREKPALAAEIKDYYVRQPPGRSFPEGIEKISVELAYLDSMAKQGKADLSKVQIEGVIVTVTKRRFSPESASAR